LDSSRYKIESSYRNMPLLGILDLIALLYNKKHYLIQTNFSDRPRLSSGAFASHSGVSWFKPIQNDLPFWVFQNFSVTPSKYQNDISKLGHVRHRPASFDLPIPDWVLDNSGRSNTALTSEW